ncbi:hypothetical protein Tco_0056286 [Tanacetum coccineum]
MTAGDEVTGHPNPQTVKEQAAVKKTLEVSFKLSWSVAFTLLSSSSSYIRLTLFDDSCFYPVDGTALKTAALALSAAKEVGM